MYEQTPFATWTDSSHRVVSESISPPRAHSAMGASDARVVCDQAEHSSAPIRLPFPDPAAFAVDGMLFSWHRTCGGYVYPPHALLPAFCARYARRAARSC